MFAAIGKLFGNSNEQEIDRAYLQAQLNRLTQEQNVMQSTIRALKTDVERIKKPSKSKSDRISVSAFLEEKGLNGQSAPSFGIGRRAAYIEQRAGRKLVQELTPEKTRRSLYPRATLEKALHDHIEVHGKIK